MKNFTLLLSLLVVLSACREEITCRALNDRDFRDFFGSFEAYPENLKFYSLNGDTASYAVQVGYSDSYTCTRTVAKDCECDVSKRLSSRDGGIEDRFSIFINTENNFNAVGKAAAARISAGYTYSYFRVNEGKENLEDRIKGTQSADEQPIRFISDTLIQNRTFNLVMVEPEDTLNGSFILDRETGIVAYTDTAGVSWYRVF